MKPDHAAAEADLHVEDAQVDLSGTPWEAWVALAIFWALAATVFHQFFTRYALNDSAAWTEEIARYLLIGTVFVGASIGIAKGNHVHVNVLYLVLPRGVARALSTAVDLLNLAFCGALVVMTVQMMQKMGNYQMTIIDLPMNIVYGVCLFGFVMMTVRALIVARINWRRGYSLLERPDATMQDR